MEEMDVSFARIYMSPGEYELWHGKPQKGNLFTPQDAWPFLFGIMWCCVAVFQTVTAVANGNLLHTPALPFLAVGLYLLFGRFIWTAIQRSRTVYVITNQKIIRKRMGNIDMVNRSNKLPIQLKVHRNGNGTITIGAADSWDYDEDNRSHGFSISLGRPGNTYRPRAGAFRLENIADPVKVHRVLTQNN